MRDLYANELQFVTGAGDAPCPPTTPVKKDKGRKGNNGFGNSGDANTAAPGGSGDTPGDKDFSQVR